MRIPAIAISVIAGFASVGAVLALSGCASDSGNEAASASASPSPSVAPTFAPAGSASDNTAYFRYVVDQAIARAGLNASTEGVAKDLAAGGFAAAGIQYSDNSTAAGMTPDSVTVAALWQGECLIAQYGPSINGLTVSVQPELASGGCLLGRSINHL